MKIKVGSKVVVNGRWMVIETLDSEGLYAASDEDGMEHFITEDVIDHVYEDDTTAVYDD